MEFSDIIFWVSMIALFPPIILIAWLFMILTARELWREWKED